MATVAISSGTNAMKLANTNARTASDPTPPMMVSVRALLPLLVASALELGQPGHAGVPTGGVGGARRRR